MEYDYYEILGVSPGATLVEIRRAYRAQAQKHHPDRGGTHAQMIRLNEAWRVLSDPVLRRDYEALRASHTDTNNSAAFAEAVQSARAKAAEYPRDWRTFESWLTNITRDFTSAEYGSSKTAGVEVATVQNSVSGWIVVNLAGIVGAVAGVFLVSKVLGMEHRFLERGKIMIVAAAFGAGTFVGARIHQALRGMFAQSEQPPDESCKIVIQCPSCGQRLRVPQRSERLTITCKACEKRFLLGSDGMVT